MVRPLAVLTALVCLVAIQARAEAPITVFAAASLSDAMEAVGAAWEARGGTPVRFAFASSSTLARQIEAGAPAALFASANERWMDHLQKQGLILADTRLSPIANRLVLIAPSQTAAALGKVELSSDLDWEALLGAQGRLAVGDPAHVPAGLYAKDVLTRLGLWSTIEPRLARADNVRAALALVARGETPLGIVYATDAAITDRVAVVATVDASDQTPITYPFAVIDGAATPEVLELHAFVTGGEGRRVFERFGFVAD